MPRGRSSGGGFGSRSNSRSSSYGQRSQPNYSTQSRAPTHTQSSMPASQPRGGMMSGIGSTIAQGMAFGAGSEVAHQAVRSVMGGGSHGNAMPMESQQPQIQPQQVENNTQAKQNPCMDFNTRFIDCLKYNNNTISMCQSIFDDLKSCEKNLI